MKPSLITFLFVFTCIFAPFVVLAQPANDNCADATELIINQQCFVTPVTTIGATHSTPEAFCAGADDDDDVWFKFVATQNTHNIVLLCLGSFDGILEASSGNCTAFANLGCSNTAGAGGQEGIALTGLTIGATYYIRVYSATNSSAAQGDAYICVQETNDICANAFEVIPAIDCMDGVGGQTRLTDPSNALPASPCAGDADDDVWYKFVATQSAHTIRMECYDFDGVLEIRSGGCGSQTNLACANAQGVNFPEEIFLNNLITGNTYYIRVWSVGSGVAAQGDFYICIDIPLIVPPNDVCSTAAILTAAATCNYTAGSTLNTQSGGGGFCGSANADDDVWYSFVATQTDYTVQLNCLGSFDGVMEISESDGTCTNFINLNCYNDGGAGAPETAIYNGLQVGTTYLIRIYSFGGAGSAGDFEICLIANAGLPTNDDCGGAIVLTPGQTCNYTAGTTQLAINNPGNPVDCPIGNADDDVWYKFTATYAAMTVHLNCMGAFNGVMETMLGLNGGNCTGFIGAGCSNNTGAGQPEEIQMTGLSVGDTYFIHIWSFGGTGSEGNFEVCVQEPLVPTNDNCAGALLLIPSGNSGCSPTIGTTVNATNAAPAGSCAGDPDDDVWYRFVATNSLHLVKLTCSAGFDGVLEVRAGACGSQNNLSCANNLGAGGTEEILLSGLTIGTTYYVRVWSFGGPGNQGSYEVCIITPLPNDICQSATLVTPNTNSSCANVTNGTTVGATSSSPAYCNPGNNYPDIWNKFVATNTTHIINVTGNGVFPYIEVYENCGGVAIKCIGIGFDEFVSGAVDNLSIGSTYYVRIYMGGSTGTFSLCIDVPQPNDECANATVLLVSPSICSTVTNGSTTNTSPINGSTSNCGNGDDDVWYQFVATHTTHKIKVAQNAGFDAAVEVRSGTCSGAVISCQNNYAVGNEIINLSGLTIGTSYFIRIFSPAGQLQGEGDFTICITAPVAIPSNDNCAGATSLTVQVLGTCTPISVTTLDASPSPGVTCLTQNYNDVWYVFTAPIAGSYAFNYDNFVNLDGAATAIGMILYTGSCTNLQSVNLSCATTFGTGGSGSRSLNLVANQTYYLRLWGNAAESFVSFNFCVDYNDPSPPVNDECVNATFLTLPVSSLMVSTVSATQSVEPLDCGPLFDQDDVWFTFTTPVTAVVDLDYSFLAGLGNPAIGLGYQLYSGTCASLTPVPYGCSAQFGNGTIGSGHTELYVTPNTTYYLRLWTTQSSTSGTFNLFLTPNQPPATDDCANAANFFPFGGWYVAATGITDYATQSLPPITCNGQTTTTANDVWAKRTITTVGNYSVKIVSSNNGSDDLYIVDIRSGTCAVNDNVACILHTHFIYGDSIIYYFEPGDYLFRVYTYSPPNTDAGQALLTMSAQPLTVLPLQLRSFTANNLPKTNQITWITATERNVSHHILERSADGLSNWQEINRQAGALQSDTERKYQYEDTKPLLISYYRLRSVDVDGTEQVSQIVSVTRSGRQLALNSVYPVPVQDELNVVFTAPEETDVQIQISDMLGRIVLRKMVGAQRGSNQCSFLVQSLPAGIYQIQLNSQGLSGATIPIIKQ